jgi:hypothetical protein
MAIGSTVSSVKYLQSTHQLDQHLLLVPAPPAVASHSPVDPVGHIQRPVGSEGEQVVSRDSLGLTGALKHEQLRQDRDSLKVDRERPENLHGRAASQVEGRVSAGRGGIVERGLVECEGGACLRAGTYNL